MSIVVLDPNSDSPHDSSHRGGGRVMYILRENFADQVTFVSSPKKVSADDTLLVPFWHPFQPAVIRKRLAKKQILTIFDVIPLKYPDKFPLGFRGKLGLIDSLNHLSHFDSFITISEASKRDIVQYLNIAPELIHVVYLTTSSSFFNKPDAVNIDKTTTQQPDLPHLPFCVYVGDINWNKNIVNIARALKIAQVKGVFVGKAFTDQYKDLDHPERAEFKAFKKETSNDEQFIFPGYVPDDELAVYYQKAVCNLLVSRDEGFGLSYLEASTQKCPSVLSDIPVCNEIADNTALFTDPEDPQSIAEKIVRLKEDPALQKDLGKESHAHIRRFTPEKFTKRLMQIIT